MFRIFFMLQLVLLLLCVACLGNVVEGTPLWSGEWETTFQKMTLTQQGNLVTGTYGWDKGRVQGQVIGNKLIGTWAEKPTYAGPRDAGTFELILSSDGNSFTGTWKYQDGTISQNKPYWNGKRLIQVDYQVVKATIQKNYMGNAILIPGYFTVPAGKLAYNISGEAANVDSNGVRTGEYWAVKEILSNNAEKYVFEHFTPTQERPVPMSHLSLPPGNYKLIVNGFPGSEATVSYLLK